MSRYDGDVMIRHTEDGGAITIIGGQPEMDQGLATAVYISLFTEPGWWANAPAGEGEKIGSECEAIEARPLTNKTRLDYEEAARQALAWLVTDGLATEVKVEAIITGVNALGLAITITEPDGKTGTLRYRVNWQGQRAELGEG